MICSILGIPNDKLEAQKYIYSLVAYESKSSG